MNVIQFDQGSCRKMRSYLDFYLNNELLVESNHEVLMHLQSCLNCSAELESLARINRLLKKAVQHERASGALQERIQREIRRSRPDIMTPPAWTQFALAATVAFVLLAAIWVAIQLRRSTDGAMQQPEQARAQLAQERPMNVLEVGLDEHAYCALHWRFSKALPTLDQVAKKMGPESAELARLVKEMMPEGYQLAEAHRCRHNGREFIHFILKNGPSIISFIITGKIGDDSLPTGAAADWQVAGVSIYSARERDQEVAGFATARHLVFVVSGLDKKDNMQIASNLAPSVHDFVARLEG